MNPENFLKLNQEEQADLLKRAYHELIHGGPLKPQELALRLERKLHNLYRHCDTDLASHQAPHQDIIKASLLQNNFAYLDLLEALAGRAAFQVPKGTEHHSDVNRAATRALKSFSGYMEGVTDLVDRLDNGELMFDHLWDGELKEIELACRQVQGRLEALLQTVRLARGVTKVVKLGTAKEPSQVHFPVEKSG
jgi:hypothetical protein